MRAINSSRGVPVAISVRRATGLWDRTRGLLGRKGLERGSGLLLEPCSGIHTVGMAFPIDAIFLSKEHTVVHLVHQMRPQRFSRYVFRAHAVLELPAGTIEETGTQMGDTLIFEG